MFRFAIAAVLVLCVAGTADAQIFGGSRVSRIRSYNQPTKMVQSCEGGVCRMVPQSQEQSVLQHDLWHGADPVDEDEFAPPPGFKATPPSTPPIPNQSVVEVDELVFDPECPTGYRPTGKKVLVYRSPDCKCGPGCTCGG